MVEHVTFNHRVVGSIPTRVTNDFLNKPADLTHSANVPHSVCATRVCNGFHGALRVRLIAAGGASSACLSLHAVRGLLPLLAIGAGPLPHRPIRSRDGTHSLSRAGAACSRALAVLASASLWARR